MEGPGSEQSPCWDGGHYGFARRPRFTRLSPAARRLWPDHGQYPLPAAGSSLAATDLCLAGLRSLPELSGAQQIPQFLAGKARGSAALGDGGACAADQARGNPRHRRRVPAALSVLVAWMKRSEIQDLCNG